MEQPPLSLTRRTRGYLVHAFTASGIFFAFLAMAELIQEQPSPAKVFTWLLVAVLIDACDGALARAWRVKETASGIDGRTIDDLLDYLTFTFIPLMLVWRMGWVPGSSVGELWGGLLFVAVPMGASLLGFANVKAKQESAGFFAGFPSYWNIAAFYTGLLLPYWGTWGNAALLMALALLTVLPVRFVYPTLAPRPWRWPVLAGALLWAVALLAMLPWYPHDVASWALWASLIYPALYTALSVYLDLKDRRQRSR